MHGESALIKISVQGLHGYSVVMPCMVYGSTASGVVRQQQQASGVLPNLVV
jgi:hypothetical protein